MGRAPPPGCLRARILGGMSETNHENQNTTGTGPEQETIGAGSAPVSYTHLTLPTTPYV